MNDQVYLATIAIVEFIGALIIVGYCGAALLALLRTRSLPQVRLLVAEGVVWGLNFKMAGSLMKTLVLHTWTQIGFFLVIFVLRTVVKWIFTWDTRQIRQGYTAR